MLRLKYDIEDLESMEEYIKEHTTGLPLNQDLFDCYKKAKQEAEELAT